MYKDVVKNTDTNDTDDFQKALEETANEFDAVLKDLGNE